MSETKLLFKRNLPILIPTFINKIGTIGLALIPILLVDLHFSADASAVTMAFIKGAGLVGIVLSGVLADQFSLKRIILLSFAMSAIGLGALPCVSSILWVTSLGVMATLGEALFKPAANLYLKTIFSARERQESLAWLRTAANAGQIASFSIGWIFVGLGTLGLFLFDSITAAIAAVFAYFLLPHLKLNSTRASQSKLKEAVTTAPIPARLLWVTALLAGCQVFFYELYMTSVSAKLRILKGDQGLPYFSKLMVINTVLCTLFAVVAAKKLKNPVWVLPLGMGLSIFGCLLSLDTANQGWVWAAFFLTAGEIFYMSLSNFMLMQLVPPDRKTGTLFGAATLIGVIGKTLGGAFAFPFVIYGKHPLYLIWGVAGIALVLFIVAIPGWKRVILLTEAPRV